VELPEGGGLVEVVKKPASPSSSEVAFYFYKTPYKPFAPAPSWGTLKVGKDQAVTLKPEGDALVTPPGKPLFPSGEVSGALTVELEKKTVTVPLGLR
jgi:hypothetical protein